jgi:hypothetical protein
MRETERRERKEGRRRRCAIKKGAATQYIEALKGSDHLRINDRRPRYKQVFGGSQYN